MNIDTVVVGEFQVNCYVVWGAAQQAIVIDPGAEPERILGLLDARGVAVSAYMLTHGHVDHISALAELIRQRPAPVGLHGADLQWAFSSQNEWPPFYTIPERPPRIERQLEDGQEWTDSGLSYRVIATPGHTPGSVCFYFPDGDVLLTGDTLFAGSVGRTDLPGGDARTLADSLKRIATLPAGTGICPGHGPASDLRQEKRTNYFMRGLPMG